MKLVCLDPKCSNNGRCVHGTCICGADFTGPACERLRQDPSDAVPLVHGSDTFRDAAAAGQHVLGGSAPFDVGNDAVPVPRASTHLQQLANRRQASARSLLAMNASRSNVTVNSSRAAHSEGSVDKAAEISPSTAGWISPAAVSKGLMVRRTPPKTALPEAATPEAAPMHEPMALEGLLAALRGTDTSRPLDGDEGSAEESLPSAPSNATLVQSISRELDKGEIAPRTEGSLGKLRVKAAPPVDVPAPASDLSWPRRGGRLLEVLQENAQAFTSSPPS